jgi:crossover junction endodeoxyribonuclease RuvC
MVILAIDPGVAGAFALLTDDRALPRVDDLPVHEIQHGRAAKIRAELDLHGFRELLVSHVIDHVFLERVAARPGQGVTSMFRFGQSSGALYGLIVGLGLPVTFARPQDWQRHAGIGAAPDAARQRAVQLFPGLAARMARKRDQHRADAVLLGVYALHVLRSHDLQHLVTQAGASAALPLRA